MAARLRMASRAQLLRTLRSSLPISARRLPLLEVENLHAGHNRGDVLRGIDLRVGRGDIVGLLGANGVGKSTLALSISGMTRISSGDIRLNGHSIVGMRPEKI